MEETWGIRRQSEIISGKVTDSGDGGEEGQSDDEKEECGYFRTVHDWRRMSEGEVKERRLNNEMWVVVVVAYKLGWSWHPYNLGYLSTLRMHFSNYIIWSFIILLFFSESSLENALHSNSFYLLLFGWGDAWYSNSWKWVMVPNNTYYILRSFEKIFWFFFLNVWLFNFDFC